MAVNDAPLYRLPFGLLFAYALSAAAIGVATGAFASFREQQQRRVNLRDGGRVAEDPFAQLRLAESAAEIDAAHDRMLANFAEMMRLARAGDEIPLALRARARWDAGKAVDWSVSAVDRLMMAAGGRAIFLSNPIQRAWRDIHAMQAHAVTDLMAVRGRPDISAIFWSCASKKGLASKSPSMSSSSDPGTLRFEVCVPSSYTTSKNTNSSTRRAVGRLAILQSSSYCSYAPD